VPENIQKPFNLNLEQAKVRFRYALYTVFGAYHPHETEKPTIFSTERTKDSDRAISELFNSGAPYYTELLKEKLSNFQPYTKEYIDTEQYLPTYNIAAEYIAGVKSRDNSKILAINALTDYVNEAREFLNKNSISYVQLENALEYISKFYHLSPKN